MAAELTRADTVALWHAVQWMALCLKMPPAKEQDAAAVERERELLRTAKRALRKVNAIRKAVRGAPGRERTGLAPGELEYASWFTASTAYMAGCSYCNGDCPSPQACGRAEHLAADVEGKTNG